MRIAVTFENGDIFQHFGHTAQFKLYNVENGAVTDTQVVDTNGNGHGALAGFLHSLCVDTLICGGIGADAQNALTNAGTRFFAGVSGSADAAVQALLGGNLAFDPNARCAHHEHHDGDCEHTHCSEHNCEGDHIQ